MALSARAYGNRASGDRLFLTVLLAASIGAVAAAWTGDVEFDLSACTPCPYQRIPYLLAAAVAGFAVMTRPNPARYRHFILVCAALFAMSSCFAVFREGVQQGWWSAPGVCEARLAPALANLQTAFTGGAVASGCDEVETSVLAMSLTMLNFVYSGLLTLVCIIAAAISDGENR